jgi:gluconolactonase
METGAVSVFRKSLNNANGNMRDRQGRLVTCGHRGRRVVCTGYDGALTVLADSHQGKRLNSPNDVVMKSDGSIWFTAPPFGLLGYYEGEKNDPERRRLSLRARRCALTVASPKDCSLVGPDEAFC